MVIVWVIENNYYLCTSLYLFIILIKYKMKKLFGCLALFSLCIGMNAQTEKSQIIENGGSGDYPAIVVADASLPTHTVYRPQDLKAAVKKEGKLPVIVYANGACFNNNVEMRLLLNEVASHGYIAIAIGPYDEESTVEQWKRVLFGNYPKGKDVVLATGERYPEPTAEQKEEARIAQEAARAAAEKAAKKKKKAEPEPFHTYPKQLLEALDWITDQNADPKSEYYHMIDLDKVAAMGQSCGGAQVLAVAHDPRIKTCVMLNTGIGDMEMSGASKECLNSVHTPMFYMIGGPTDIAHQNANKDFERLQDVPVVMFNSHDGHNGTYYEEFGGPYAVVATRWLDWQLKGMAFKSAIFLDDDYAKMVFPTWTFQRKNF